MVMDKRKHQNYETTLIHNKKNSTTTIINHINWIVGGRRLEKVLMLQQPGAATCRAAKFALTAVDGDGRDDRDLAKPATKHFT